MKPKALAAQGTPPKAAPFIEFRAERGTPDQVMYNLRREFQREGKHIDSLSHYAGYEFEKISLPANCPQIVIVRLLASPGVVVLVLYE